MRVQLAGLCLAESKFVQIRLHLGDDLQASVARRGVDLKVDMRDRLTRQLRPLPGTSWFYIVIEDRAKDGSTIVRPHVHGAVRIPDIELPTTAAGVVKARFKRRVVTHGMADAKFLWGRMQIRRALRAASGNKFAQIPTSGSSNVAANVWTQRPYQALFNEQWVSYAFKNKDAVSLDLPENRLSMSRSLNQEAQKLWNLIRDGEAVISQWM